MGPSEQVGYGGADAGIGALRQIEDRYSGNWADGFWCTWAGEIEMGGHWHR